MVSLIYKARTLTLWVILSLVSFPLSASNQIFSATLEDSRWQLDAGLSACVLRHEIPGFGVAHFEQQANRQLTFALYVAHAPLGKLQASLTSRPPVWKFPAKRKDLGSMTLQKGKNPLVLPRDMALRLYYELEQGMEPTLTFNDWADGQDEVVVSLSPVRFREAQAQFSDCIGELPFLDFTPVFEKYIHFSTASSDLTRSTRSQLNQAVNAYRKNRNLKIVLGGHADERGADTYNMRLSKRRTASVARYLKFKGIPGNKIEHRHFGETQPLAAGSVESAWSKNRRVAVWLADKNP
ncbi:MAG: OmpA family protein [Gammaproteobacteria bacterium]